MATSTLSPCTPWYFPFLDENHRMCDPWETKIFKSLFHSTRFETECSYCLPDCKRTLYKQKNTIEPLQNCDENSFAVSNFCLHNKMSNSVTYWRMQISDDLDTNNSDYTNFPGLHFKTKLMHH